MHDRQTRVKGQPSSTNALADVSMKDTPIRHTDLHHQHALVQMRLLLDNLIILFGYTVVKS